MTSEKDKFAASMINHWYVIARGMEIGRLSRHPRSKNYNSIKNVSDLNSEDFRKLASTFSSYTAKNFYANIQYRIMNDPDVIGTPEVDGIKVEFGRATQRRGLPIDVDTGNDRAIPALIQALNFPEQHHAVKTLLESIPGCLVGEDSVKFQIMVPSAKRRMNQSFAGLEREAEESFNNIKAFMKLSQIISSTLTEKDKIDVDAKTSVIKISGAEFENGTVSIDEITLEETEEARNQRVLRQKLEERLRKRTQSVTSIDLDPAVRTVTYNFEGQDHQPFVMNLDLITTW